MGCDANIFSGVGVGVAVGGVARGQWIGGRRRGDCRNCEGSGGTELCKVLGELICVVHHHNDYHCNCSLAFPRTVPEQVAIAKQTIIIALYVAAKLNGSIKILSRRRFMGHGSHATTAPSPPPP